MANPTSGTLDQSDPNTKRIGIVIDAWKAKTFKAGLRKASIPFKIKRGPGAATLTIFVIRKPEELPVLKELVEELYRKARRNPL